MKKFPYLQFLFFCLSFVVLMTGCASTKDQEEEKKPEKVKTQNQLDWEKLQKKLEEENRKRRMNTSDFQHQRLNEFEVFPGRSGRRSEKLYDEKDRTVIPKLW